MMQESDGVVGELQVTQRDATSVSVVGQELVSVPLHLGAEYGGCTYNLDLSHNALTVLENLSGFTKLRNLVVDSNQLSGAIDPEMEPIKSLTTLCVNDNSIDDIDSWLTGVARAFPNLTYLSMLKNPSCPNYFIGKDQEDYQRYRYYVLHKLPKLKFLDSTPVSAEERAEAERVGSLMKVARPTAAAYNAASDLAQIAPDDEDLDSEIRVAQPGQSSASYGVCRYVYYGRQSEGNRFISNDAL